MRTSVDDVLDISVITPAGHPVAVVATGLAVHKYRETPPLHWDGRTTGGALAAPGTYLVRVRFQRAGQTVTVPNLQLAPEGLRRVILATTLGHSLSRAGLILDALLAAEALCALGRTRRIALAGALALTPVLLAGALWKSSQMVHLRHHALLAVVGILAALALVGGARRPLPVAPQPAGAVRGGRAAVSLLAAVGRHRRRAARPLRRDRRRRARAGDLGRAARASRRSALLERALAAVVVLYAIQALYTPDLSKAVQEVGFFFVPFALLFVLLRRARWDRALLERVRAGGRRARARCSSPWRPSSTRADGSCFTPR